ncbi:dual specificity protein phosphatase family protein [Bremerella sp. JC770]|uniref:protein-tyrosine phosphatase family protein n=1 Tax=Bremerella sp. JC770 TaxID=3232137 RepID=UPI0034594590
MQFELAENSVVPPSSFSYWVVPSKLLAGAYPGHRDATDHVARVHALVDAGARTFVNLMEADETDGDRQPFRTYDDVARHRSAEVVMRRHAIVDLSIPTPAVMKAILDEIDTSLNSGAPVYVHCWGGIGRTGTVIGCWLLRHALADADSVLDVLKQLRKQDQERGHRLSPETDEQRTFIRQWCERGNRALDEQ